IDEFLNEVNLPKLNEQQKEVLELPLPASELHEAVNSMPKGKAPGPDDFPAEFDKDFWTLLSPTCLHLRSCYYVLDCFGGILTQHAENTRVVSSMLSIKKNM
uniref:Uncharacterized protein n=1 Tax=Kryptolebias marmoratus TaxID=37003 RepID=A0A3Q3B0V2_KRYMA